MTSQPPATGPTTNAIPVQAVQVPIAAPRSSPLKTTVIVASAAGVSSAPATPCSARAKISASALHASAQSAEVNPNVPRPIRKILLPPKRSPSEPPTRISEPSVRR